MRQFFARARGMAPLVRALGGLLAEPLQGGVEGRVFTAQLQRSKDAAERGLRVYTALQSVAAQRPGILEDEEIAELLRYAREARDLLDWIEPLLTRLLSWSPFDESALPPAPDRATAPGYVSVGEARARLHARRKP